MYLRIYILIVYVVVTSCSSIKRTLIDVRIEEMTVYENLSEFRYTSASAYAHFDDLAKQRTRHIEVSSDDLTNFERIMTNAKQLNHFQRKLAGELLFCDLKYNDIKVKSRIVISLSAESAGIMDLSNRKDFVVFNQADIIFLQEFKANVQEKFNQ